MIKTINYMCNLEEIKNLNLQNVENNWVLWGRLSDSGKPVEVDSKGKINKCPINPHSLGKAMSNNPTTWGTFEQVSKKYSNGNYAGVGIQLTNTNIIAIDIDNCIDVDNDNRLNDIAMDIVQTLESYFEISPSKTGIRILVYDKDNEFENYKKSCKETHYTKNSNIGLEVYCSCDNRYVTLTGHSYLEDSTPPINNNIESVKAIYDKYMKKIAVSKKINKVQNDFIPSSEEIQKTSPKMTIKKVLNVMRKAKNKDKFIDIFDNGSCAIGDSETDQSLMNILYFYTQNEEQLRELFFMSKHHENRDKSNKGLEETKEGQHNFECCYNKAKTHITKIYKGRKRNETDLPRFYFEDDEGKLILDVEELRDHLRDKHNIFYTELGFFGYSEGCYKINHDREVAKLIETHIEEKKDRRESQVRECSNRLAREFKSTNIFNTRKNIANFNNYILEIQKNGDLKVLEHTPELYYTFKFKVDYNKNARCEVWQKFLNDVLPESQQKLLQEILGYFLIADNQAKRIFGLYGKGDCGKSVILTTLNRILGSENVSNITWQKLSNPDHKHVSFGVYQKLANITGDLPQQPLGDTGLLKMMSGSDMIDCEPKHGKGFSFDNTCRLLASMNSLPPSPKDKSSAYYNRLLIIPFLTSIPEEKQDKHLINKFDLEGVASWMIEGLQRLFKNDLVFSETAENTDIIKKYKIENDNVNMFIEECCILQGSCVGQDLYNAYEWYCSENGFKSYNKRNFKEKLVNTATIKEDKNTGDKKNQRGYKNISLNPEGEFYEDIKNQHFNF